MEPLFTPTQLAEVQAYHAPLYISALVDLVVWPLVLIGTARFLTRPFHALAVRWAKRVNVPALTRVWKGPEWAETIFFALLFFGFFVLLNLPLDLWFGYVREHQYGLSNESLGAFLFDGLKHQLFLVIAVTSFGFGVFGAARRTRHWWWLLGIVVSLGLIVSTAIDPYRASLYVDQNSLPQGSLRARLTEMLQAEAIPFADIFVIHTGEKSVRVAAAFTGTGPTRTILLSDTLLEAMTENEVVAAVAHEAGHVNESRWPGRILTLLAMFALVGYLEWLFRRSSQRGWFGITARGDVRVLPLLVLTVDLATTVVAPFSGAMSRERELAADQFALKVTRDPDAIVSLLVKLGRINKADPDPPRWYVLSGVTHPTIFQRVEAIQKNATPPPTTPVKAGTSEQQLPGVIR